MASSSFLNVANKAAKLKVYLWARDVFRETYIAFLRQIVVEQHVQQQQQQQQQSDEEPRTIVVTEQNLYDADAVVERLGYQWIQVLNESYQIDAAEAVRDALLRGHFSLLDPDGDNDDSSSSMGDNNDDNDNSGSLLEDDNVSPPPAAASNATTEDICGLYAMAKQRLTDTALNPINSSMVSYWHPLPAATTSDESNNLYLPQATILSNNIMNQRSCYKNTAGGGIFGCPNPYLKPWDGDQWCQYHIHKLDHQQQGSSQLPYTWNLVQELSKAIPERLHSTTNSATANNKGKNIHDTIEIVPKSTTMLNVSSEDNEDLVSSTIEPTLHNTNNNGSNVTATNSTLPRDNDTEDEGEEPILLGSAKFQERLAIKKRRRKRLREEEQALQQPDPNNRESSINNTNTTTNNLCNEDEARQPSNLPDQLWLHWSDIEEDDDTNSNNNTLVPTVDEPIQHTIQGALKVVGLFHEQVQSIIDSGATSLNKDDMTTEADRQRRKRKLQKERLGKVDTTVVIGDNISDPISNKRGQAASSKVLRVERRGQEWLEFDLGETILQLDVAAAEEEVTTSSCSIRSDASSTSARGEKRKACYKLYAFRSLEISALIGD